MFAHLVHIAIVLAWWSPVASEPTCPPIASAPTAIEEHTFLAFNNRIDSYMKVHRDVERTLAPERIFEDPEDLFEGVQAMRSGISTARPDAQLGSIFRPDIAALIRSRLLRTLMACGYTVEEVLASINEERLPGVPRPRINEPFPWALGSSMWPTLLAVLPSLPEELQYRFADRDLVLIDMHADLVVDILTNALPSHVARHTAPITADWH